MRVIRKGSFLLLSVLGTIVLLFSVLFFSGCSSKKQSFTVEQPNNLTEEQILLSRLSQSHNNKLLVLKDEHLMIPKGEKAQTMLAFKNADDVPELFDIEICQNCHFNVTKVALDPGNSTVLYFDVDGIPGTKTLVIRDKDGNFYTKASFIVVN